MYRIGLFSKISKVTVKALRFYEEEGLLDPCYKDPVNNYRYYSSDQLLRVHKIVALRQCGFSIPEIKQMLAGKKIAELLVKQKQRLEGQATETAVQLSSINHYIESLGKDHSMKYEIVLKELPHVLVYSKRMKVESYDSYFTEIPKIGEEVVAANPGLHCVEDPPYCFIIYHDGEYKDHDIDVEYCEAIPYVGVETDTIKFKTIERVPQAACARLMPRSLNGSRTTILFRRTTRGSPTLTGSGTRRTRRTGLPRCRCR